jgi:hypothetical protein
MSKVVFKDVVEAEIVVSVRLSGDDVLEGKVSATCEYAPKPLPGATCSASVPIPDDIAQKIHALLVKARDAAAPELGAALNLSKAEAFRTSVTQREIA